jgi:RNA polymerase sigma-70 factor (ECF subfamily)
VERGSGDPHLRTLAARRNADDAGDAPEEREERAWKSGMTWPPGYPFALVLQRARQQDQQALSALYKRFLPVVYRFVLARVDDPHLAEDLTADTFFAMVKDIGGTRASDELGFSAWVLGIARSRIAQHFRRQQIRAAAERELAPTAEPITSQDQDEPLTIITARESWGIVVAALNRLTEEQRAVVLYRCVLGYSAEEVGSLLDKQPGTIRALQFRALASLARHLGIEQHGHHGHQGQQAERTQPGAEKRPLPSRHHAGRNSDADRR